MPTDITTNLPQLIAALSQFDQAFRPGVDRIVYPPPPSGDNDIHWYSEWPLYFEKPPKTIMIDKDGNMVFRVKHND